MIGGVIAILGMGLILGGFYFGAFSALTMIVGAGIEVWGLDYFVRNG